MISPPSPSIVISIDFERRWGVHHRLGLDFDAYRDHLDNVEGVVLALLRLFVARNIKATWAAVGALACRDWDEYFTRVPPPPRYEKPSLAISPRYADLDLDGRLHFAPELLRAIHETPGQELGTHTFSHVLMREAGVTAEDVSADLKAVARLWCERFGQPPVSLVFPRNQVAFLSVIRSCDIRMWRGNEVGWYHDCNDIGRNHLLQPIHKQVCKLFGLLTGVAQWITMHIDIEITGICSDGCRKPGVWAHGDGPGQYFQNNVPRDASALLQRKPRRELTSDVTDIGQDDRCETAIDP